MNYKSVKKRVFDEPWHRIRNRVWKTATAAVRERARYRVLDKVRTKIYYAVGVNLRPSEVNNEL